MKPGLKLSAINSLWQYCFASTKPDKFGNISHVIKNESAYLDEGI